MEHAKTAFEKGLFTGFFRSTEERSARRREAVEEQRRQRADDLKAERKLREAGYYDNHLPGTVFHPPYYY